MPITIGAGYKKYSGKDTVADYLVEEHGFKKIAFADALKRGVQEIFGFSDEQLWGKLKGVEDEFWGVTPGKILQLVGTELFREKLAELLPEVFGDKDIWVRAGQRGLQLIREENPEQDVVISDTRFHNEGDLILGPLDGYLIRVDRALEKRQAYADEVGDDRDLTHGSETALDDFDWSQPGCYVIDNNYSLNRLYDDVEAILEVIKREERQRSAGSYTAIKA